MATKYDLLFHICGEIAKDIEREYINKFRSFPKVGLDSPHVKTGRGEGL